MTTEMKHINNKLQLSIDEILYLKMILNSNVEEIDVWREEEQNGKYANMIRKLYDEIEALYDSINNRHNQIKAINDSLKAKMLKKW